MVIRQRLFLYFISIILTTVGLAGQNIEKLSKKCEGGKKNACAKLVMIAKTHKDASVRSAAVEKISGKEILAEIARNDKNGE